MGTGNVHLKILSTCSPASKNMKEASKKTASAL